ncbi:MAG TPA: CoA-transferase [Candidatus Binatia bacterium]|nr:CoA-transferase [Candidatus Binatia bacterium]HYV85037.1 CoA-transferase [Patescibacteria group bacterium]
MAEYTTSELMVSRAAKELKNGDVVFVGIGVPSLAVNLAYRMHAPGICMIYESGAVGCVPKRLPISIGDPCLVTGSLAVVPMLDVFNLYLQRGLIDVGFLGGAQVDRFGNINSTVIGDYAKPKVRLPGSGGACEIAALAKKVVITIGNSKRTLPERVDFVTSPGYLRGGRERESLGLKGGPELVITDMGVYRFDPETREMVLVSMHPGVTVQKIKENIGWDVKVARELTETPPPTPEEIRIIRDELDPQGIFLKSKAG